MAIAKVQDTGKLVRNGVTSDTVSFGTLPVIGNHVFVQMSAWSPGAGFDGGSYSDNQGNAWNRDNRSTSSGSGRAAIASAKVVNSAGTFTITADVPDGSYCVWCASEFSGLDPTAHHDKSGDSGAGTGSPCAVTAAGANLEASSLVLASISLTSNLTNVGIQTPASSGYTSLAVEQDGLNHQGAEHSYKITSGVETSAASWTHSTVSGRSAALATYRGALSVLEAAPGEPRIQRSTFGN